MDKNQIVKERQFYFPEGGSPEIIVDRLVAWLQSDQGKQVHPQVAENGWFILVKDPSGKLTRLIKRKPEAFFIIMRVEANQLAVQIGHGIPVKTEKSDDSSRKNSIAQTAFRAFSVPTRFAADTAAGIAGMWVDHQTADSILDFINESVTDLFKSVDTGSNTSMVDDSQSCYIEPMNDPENNWICAFLKSDERLLAWISTSTRAPDGETWKYLLTSHRSALVSFSSTGFQSIEELPERPLTVTDAIGRDTVKVEGIDLNWRTQINNDHLFREISQLPAMDAIPRITAASCLNFMNRSAPGHYNYCLDLLSHLCHISNDPLLELSRTYVSLCSPKKSNNDGIFENLKDPKPLLDLGKRLTAQTSAKAFYEWSKQWALDSGEQIALAGWLLTLFPDDPDCGRLVSFMLIEARSEYLKKNKEPSRHIIPDIHFADCLTRCERPEDAVDILEKRLSVLPDESLSDLLPPQGSDLTKGEGGQLIKVKIVELLLKAKKAAGQPVVPVLNQLAALQPLVTSRLKDLYDAADDDIRKRLLIPIRLLEGSKEQTTDIEVAYSSSSGAKPLNARDIEEKIRHPASRKGTVLNKIQAFLASPKKPDHSVLKSYAKRVNPDDYPELISSITDGCLILGMKSVEAFISFGDANVGIRGYEGSPPFILIGSAHLEKNSGYFMTCPELCFTIGMELAHLRFKHERITRQEVWEGAFDKTMSVLEMVPLVGGYLGKIGSLGKVAGHASDVASRIGDIQGYMSRAQNLASSAQDIYKRINPDDDNTQGVSDDEQKLIGAFREMQLTADRAALVVCGDLKSAVSAIFKSSHALHTEFHMADRYGLDTFLSRTGEDGQLMFQDLAIRLAALFSFYLSDDYHYLSTAARTA